MIKKAMILAAGRGERMRPLTDEIPKALIQVANKPLIVYLLENLAKAGITEIVINLAHLGEQIKRYLADGSAYGVKITYSQEPEGGYETGGGIYHALPLLGPDPFLVINSDILTDYPFQELKKEFMGFAHLVLVDNPKHHLTGDFYLENGLVNVNDSQQCRLTFSGIGLYHPNLFSDCTPGSFPLRDLFSRAIKAQQLSGEHYQGQWFDVGTADRLVELNDKAY